MNPRKILLILAALGIAIAAFLYSTFQRSVGPEDAQSVPEKSNASPNSNSAETAAQNAVQAPTARTDRIKQTTSASQARVVTSPLPVSQKSFGPLVRNAEGRISPSALADFDPVPFSGGKPAYDGEKVTAYIALPSSGRKVALTPNQLGEFPRIQTKPSEQVEVRLAFTSTKPGDRVAVVVQDGGTLQSGMFSSALPLDEMSQIAFAYTVSANPGVHRVSITTPSGELKTLEFWAGPPPVIMRSAKL